jgi:hypothetical protein
MSLRKWLLRLMLASLAFSALAGVAAVLLAGRDVIWRVVGTGATAAVASGLLLVLSLLMDKEKSWAAGLFGMAATIAAFILTLILVWNVSWSSRGDWSLALSLLLLLGTAPPMMFFLRVMFAEGGRWAGIVGAIACAIGFLGILAAIWLEAFGSQSSTHVENIAFTAWIITLFGVVAAGSLAGVGINRRWWRWIGVTAAAVAGLMAIVGLWEHADRGAAAFAIVAGLAAIVTHANLALLCPLKPGQRWVRVGTIAAVVVTSLLIDVITINEERGAENDLTARGAGAAAIAAACGTLALLVFARINRKIGLRIIPTSVTGLTVVCPWCQKKQSLPLGESSCAGCGLKFRLGVEEPRCPNCDYLLYMLRSDRCPECGTSIRSQPAAAPIAAAGIPGQATS